VTPRREAPTLTNAPGSFVLPAPRYGKAKCAAQIGVSTTTFLALSIWLGPTAACWLIAIAATLTVWFWLCRRFPVLGWAHPQIVQALARC
jgi:hypothetical protein